MAERQTGSACVVFGVRPRETKDRRRSASAQSRQRPYRACAAGRPAVAVPANSAVEPVPAAPARSEEHTSELQSLMRISYAVFCLKKKTQTQTYTRTYETNAIENT